MNDRQEDSASLKGLPLIGQNEALTGEKESKMYQEDFMVGVHFEEVHRVTIG